MLHAAAFLDPRLMHSSFPDASEQEIFTPIRSRLSTISETTTSTNEIQNLQGYQYFTSRLNQLNPTRIRSDTVNDEVEHYWVRAVHQEISEALFFASIRVVQRYSVV